jgi:alanine racemase
MGVVKSKYFDLAATNRITLSISNNDQLSGLKDLTKKLKIHIKVDSGMNRLGFKHEIDVINALQKLRDNKNIFIEGIFTHFSTADCDKEYLTKQVDKFQKILGVLNFKFNIIHVSNSSSAIKYEKEFSFTTHVRLGISLYGLTLDEETNFLKSCYKLITHISEIKHLEVGDKVGYGATYTASKEELIGILPIGYADGFIRKNRDSFVEINGGKYPIVGTICMDQMFIRIHENITKEHDVIMFGNIISIDDVASRLGTINYEVICQISYRVPKIYIK